MQEPHEDEEGVVKSHFQAALEAALAVAKRKIVSGPSDHIGIMLFNTVCPHSDPPLHVHV